MQARIVCLGGLIIVVGFWGMLYYSYSQPQNGIGNIFSPFIPVEEGSNGSYTGLRRKVKGIYKGSLNGSLRVLQVS